jgi:hypothetical protein
LIPKKFNLTSTGADSCVYSNEGELHTIIGIYVDDNIIASMKSDYVNEILDYLKSAFKVVEGNMDYFVDFQIERNLLTGDIFIHQTRYITYVLTRFGMLDAHSMTIPADYKSKLLKTLLGVILDPEVNVLY